MAGWINIDVSELVKTDIQDDVTVLSTVADGTADLIYASHVLEHTGRETWKQVLEVWCSKLKPGGILRIAVPDFKAAVLWYQTTGDILAVTGLICGGQRNAEDFHYVIFDETLLTQGMLKVGLVDVKQWDWKSTDHRQYDDYSQAYLPHMNKETGLLVSLNLQATKPH